MVSESSRVAGLDVVDGGVPRIPPIPLPFRFSRPRYLLQATRYLLHATLRLVFSQPLPFLHTQSPAPQPYHRSIAMIDY